MAKYLLPVHEFLRWLIGFLRSLQLPIRRLFRILFPYDLSAKDGLGFALKEYVCSLLPQRPRRRLSISSAYDVEEESPQAFSQSQSLLFNKLPPEIRQQIYLYALGERTIHLVPKHSRLDHVLCTGSSYPNLRSYACWTIRTTSVSPSIAYILREKDWSGVGDGLLNLLQTCRKIYSEAVHILYAGNTFDVPTPESIILLVDTVLPHRLNNIRSIHMSWHFCRVWSTGALPSQAQHDWDKCWSILSTIRSLRHLRVILHNGSSPMSGPFEEEMFEPAWSVKLIRKWEIITVWGNTGADFEGAPFRVVRISNE